MAGQQFSSAGPLITFETVDKTFSLKIDALKKIIFKCGGRYVEGVTAKTSVFILGAVERFDIKKHNKGDKKGELIPTWAGTTKQAAVEDQLNANGQVRRKAARPDNFHHPLYLPSQSLPMRQMTFVEWMEHYNVEEECFLNSNISRFAQNGVGNARRVLLPPGPLRTQSQINMFHCRSATCTRSHSAILDLLRLMRTM